MTAYKNKINNKTLSLIMNLLKQHYCPSKNVIRIKIHEHGNEIVLQAKNVDTRQVIRFKIFITPVSDVKVCLLMRERNPNTVEYFDDFFTLKEVIEITDLSMLSVAVAKGYAFLKTNSTFNKTEFNKIKTCLIREDMSDDNVLLRTIESVSFTNEDTTIRFKNDTVIFKFINKLSTFIRKPHPGDYFFNNTKGRFQTFSPDRASYHFEF